MLTTTDIKKVFETFKKLNPQPTTELIYHNEFELLIAVILSAQATDKGVNIATEKLFKVANTPEKIAELGEEGLKQYIKSINFFNNKAKNVIATCKALVEKHHGKVPHNREALEALPGVGRKTANVILNTAFGEATMAVDTHIFRVANRIGLCQGKTPLEIETKLLKVIPKQYIHDAHHWLILHGRYICKARKPLCPQCPIAQWCQFSDKTAVL